ncbi:MAG: hypothetical protein FIA95_12685 [Gemmatimonadetes bacterium]|nr:hypothetical protein [Gemmatimonadota bacterium]
MRAWARPSVPGAVMILGVVVSAAMAAGTHRGRVLARATHDLASGRAPLAVAALGSREGGDPLEAVVLGTALLEVGREGEAATVLAAATRSPLDDVRFPALHNLSVAHLRMALARPADRHAHARRAAQAAAGALELRPEEEGTRWNLELARRLLEPDEQQASALRILDGLRSEESMALARGAGALLGGGSQTPDRRGPPW